MIRSACMVVHSYCPGDPRVRREAEALSARGARVDVICLRDEGERPREMVAGVRYLRMPIRRRRGGVLRYVFEYTIFFVLSFAVSSVLAVRRRYDIFQAHNMPDGLILCGLAHKLRGAKLVLDLHDLMPEVYMAKYGLAEGSAPVSMLAMQEKWCVKVADLTLTTSRAFLRRLRERSGGRGRTRIVLNSPDEAVFPRLGDPPPEESGVFRLIYHGTVVHRSGLDVALRALALLRDEIPGICLKVLGGGDALEECVELAEQLGLEGAVVFLGQRPIEEIPRHVERSDLGIVPNRRNPFTERNLPTRIFEYVRMRRPVIVARTGGVLDYFGEEELLYFEPGDEGDLARAIREAHRNPQRAREVMERGMRVYERYRWERERERYLRLLGALAAGEDLPA